MLFNNTQKRLAHSREWEETFGYGQCHAQFHQCHPFFCLIFQFIFLKIKVFNIFYNGKLVINLSRMLQKVPFVFSSKQQYVPGLKKKK